jgi:DNA-binding FadR family transcriptional regulator
MMINTFRDYFYLYRPALLHIQDGLSQSTQDHRQMLEAMKKNPRWAEGLVQKHLERGKELILREMDEGRTIP